MPMPVEITRRIGPTVTVSGALTAGQYTPADATAGAVTLTLPVGPRNGASLSVGKGDATANTITISGNIRGAQSSLTLAAQYETLEFRADSNGAWWPQLNHLPKPYVQGLVAAETARAQAAELAIQQALLTELPEWQPSTAYTQGFLVVNPSGQIVQANTAFTSGTTYNASNWTILSLTVQTIAAMIAAQATSDANTYLPRWQANTAYTANQLVVAPDGSTVQALASFTSATTYSAANWTTVVQTAASVAAAYPTIAAAAGTAAGLAIVFGS